MTLSKPCVVSDVGDSRYLLGDGGFVVSTNQPSEFAEKILSLSSERKEYREDMGIRARNRVAENFTMNICFKKFHDAYIELTS